MTNGSAIIRDGCKEFFLIICPQNCMLNFVLYLQLLWGILSEYDSAKINKIWYNLIQKNCRK